MIPERRRSAAAVATAVGWSGRAVRSGGARLAASLLTVLLGSGASADGFAPSPVPSAAEAGNVLEVVLDVPFDADEASGTRALEARLGDAETLGRWLRTGDVRHVLVWTRPSSQFRSSIPQPIASAEGEHPALRVFEELLRARGVALLVGTADREPGLESESLTLPTESGPVRFRRFRRPSSTRYLWYDEDLWRRSPIAERGFVVRVPAEGALPKPLDLVQAELDLRCARARGEDSPVPEAETLRSVLAASPLAEGSTAEVLADWVPRILAQSDLCSAVFRVAFARGPVTAYPLEGLRQVAGSKEPSAEDPVQSLLAPAFFAGEAPLVAPQELLALPVAREAAATSSPDVLPDFVLGREELAALRSFERARLSALRALAHHLLLPSAETADAVIANARRCEDARREVPEHRRPGSPGVPTDRETLADYEPWRVHVRDWELSRLDGARAVALPPRRTFVIDDPRLAAVAESWGEWWNASTLDLSLDSVDPTREVYRLEAVVPLAEARLARLELKGDLDVLVELNGVVLAQRELHADDGSAFRLALPLAAARNVLRLRIRPRAPRFQIRWLPLPRRFEGNLLGHDEIRDLLPPMVVVEHPNALDGKVFFLPESRASAGQSGGVRWVVEPTRDQRIDVWLRALAPPRGPCSFEVRWGDLPAQTVELDPASGWTWLRLPAPVHATAGSQPLLVSTADTGAMFDTVALLETGTVFPVPPDGDALLSDSVWRYDVLGRGQRLDLSPVHRSPDRARSFELSESGVFRVHVWLSGAAPLPTGGDPAQVELGSGTSSWRFVLPAATPLEEWVPLGDVHLRSRDPVTVRLLGEGEPQFLCLVRQ